MNFIFSIPVKSKQKLPGKNFSDWKNIFDLIPQKFKKTPNLKRSGIAGFFSASLELSKEGILNITQKKSFDKILIKEKK